MHAMKRAHQSIRLIVIATLAVGLLASVLPGCSHDYRSIVVRTGPTKDIHLGPLWNSLAAWTRGPTSVN